MPSSTTIKVGLLKQSELEEADRIFRLAFGTFLRLPDPLSFMSDRGLLESRWRSANVKVLAARDGGRLIASNVVTQWGSFGFFGPLTVLPEYWDRGVAQRLLEATMTIFERWGVRHSGLFTFPQSAKHVALYQKFGYWPRYLTAILTLTPEANGPDASAVLSALPRSQREEAIQACGTLTHKIDDGLDLTGEIRAVLAQHTGYIVLNYRPTRQPRWCRCWRTFRQTAGCLRGFCFLARSHRGGWHKPGSRRCIPPAARTWISGDLAGCRHAAPACGRAQSAGRLRD